MNEDEKGAQASTKNSRSVGLIGGIFVAVAAAVALVATGFIAGYGESYGSPLSDFCY